MSLSVDVDNENQSHQNKCDPDISVPDETDDSTPEFKNVLELLKIPLMIQCTLLR